VPTGGRNVVEVIVLFVRDMIAKPALHEKAWPFMPFLLTLFVFILGMNVLGLIPLENVSALFSSQYRVGGGATSILTVCAGLAFISLVTVLALSWRTTAIRLHEHRHWPIWLAAALSPFAWVISLSPRTPGLAGKLLFVPLMGLELVSVFTRVAALMIRLFANMLSGHTLVAVFLMFGVQSLEGYVQSHSSTAFYVAPLSVLASAAVRLLDVLIAGLQAYIFTFLTAIYLGIYIEPSHG
jgi:F-type H+-transporting ATPase subunit a